MRRNRTAVALLVLAAVVVNLAPTASADSYQRYRNSLKFWTPTYGAVEVRNPRPGVTAIARWDWRWNYQWELIDLYGAHRAIEVDLTVPRLWARDYTPNTFAAHNLPSSARPYRDTTATDPTTELNPGFGAADANYLTFGVQYFAEVSLDRLDTGSTVYPASASVAASTRRDHDLPFCSIAVEYCVFSDYAHHVVRPRDLSVTNATTTSRSWVGNYIGNYSFESALSGWTATGAASVTRYCQPNGRRSDCYADVLATSAGSASYYTDVSYPVAADDNYTVEASIRCTAGVGDCRVGLYYYGLGGATEVRGGTFFVNDDGLWYDCRIDLEHNGGGAGFSSAHGTFRALVQNLNASRSIGIDQVTVSLAVERVTGTRGDTNVPPAGPICNLGGVY